jgi:hemoglobin/transferrin/lactoferrin receptor protein
MSSLVECGGKMTKNMNCSVKKIFLLFTFFLMFQTLWSQDLKVFDAETLEPVENVALYNKMQTASAISGPRGVVSLDPFALDDSIYFQHPTYKPIVRTKQQLKSINYSLPLDKRVIKLKGFVVSAYRWEQNKEEIPNKISTLTMPEIEFKNPQTAADLLGASNEVFIQKSQLGGGSPMIRGFATNSVLLVVDGVRMNNAIYRSGNLQNVISLDPHAIESSEIIFGPGSVTYGSDALGGVMDFHTKSVKLSTSDEPYHKLNAVTRYSSANKEKTGHIDYNYGRNSWGLLSSITYSDYGDQVMGSHQHPDYQREEYMRQIQGADSIVENPNPNEQVPSGYDQLNLMQKVRFRPSSDFNLSYGFHWSSTSNIPRYDRLIQRKDGHLKNARWYYGPQKWSMHALNGRIHRPGAIFDNLKFTLAYQNYQESRHDRGYREQWLRHRTEKVQATSVNIDFDKDVGDDLLYYGVEYVYNSLQSTANSENIVTGEERLTQTRYPNGDNHYNTFSAYLSYKNNMGDNLTMITGLRYNHYNIRSGLDTSAAYYNFPFDQMTLSTGAFNGSIGLVYRPGEQWQFNVNGSSGFHAPNIDDMAKVFDSEPRSVIMPNENLKPEYAYNVDLAVKKRFGDAGRVEVTGFYTWVEDAMVRREATFNGRDSIYYDGVLSQVHKVVNANQARIYGVSLDVELQLHRNLLFSSNLTFTQGEDDAGEPLRHVAPTFGQSELQYEQPGWKMALYARYNGEISHGELAPSERSKTHMYALDDQGQPYSPAWWTLNLKGSYHITKSLSLDAGVENILDVRYRPYSSGIVAPGRNFIAALRARF